MSMRSNFTVMISKTNKWDVQNPPLRYEDDKLIHVLYPMAAQQQLANMRSGGALLAGSPTANPEGADPDGDSENRPGTYL